MNYSTIQEALYVLSVVIALTLAFLAYRKADKKLLIFIAATSAIIISSLITLVSNKIKSINEYGSVKERKIFKNKTQPTIQDLTSPDEIIVLNENSSVHTDSVSFKRYVKKSDIEKRLVLHAGGTMNCSLDDSGRVFLNSFIAMGNKSVINFRIDENNTILIDADVNSIDGRFAAHIKDNIFTVNPNNSFKVCSDDHGLTVWDSYKIPVIQMNYDNNQSVTVTGYFYNDGSLLILGNQDMRFIHREITPGIVKEFPISCNILFNENCERINSTLCDMDKVISPDIPFH